MLFRVFFLVCLAVAATAAPFSSLYFFGDSLTDTGNVLKATSVLSNYTFGLVPKHPTAPYEAGRFTNGPVWAEHVAARLGHSSDAAPGGMSMGAFGRVGGPGNNFAIGGARTDESGALGLLNFLIPTGMSRQVDFYLDRSGGVADPEGLYFFLGAGNDLRDAARISDPTRRMLAAQAAGANIAYSVRDLYFAGARQFVLINSPDIGLIPETMGDGISEAGTDAAVQFNTWLGLYGDYLRYGVPGFSLEYFDLFGLHHDLITEYGLDAVRPCKSTPETCDSALFFDSVHPTARVHEIFGNQLADQILGINAHQNDFYSAAQHPVPEPCTAVLTFVSVAGLVLIRRKQYSNR
ncbi:MAG TPA: SGNH/GDSL hydrolase family protein [Bryobacteraceae bacterium]|nr:SGNH/GDSL hydrolase family protein [Bryobacteraceae bacterium]